jgi:hypothetical protein
MIIPALLYSNRTKRLECTAGFFAVYTRLGKNTLVYKETVIATLGTGDFKQRYGGIEGWLRQTARQTANKLFVANKRLAQAGGEDEALQRQQKELTEILNAAKYFISNKD